MTRIKTATIQIFPLFQARGYGARLLYRGQCLLSVTMADKREAMIFIENAAKSQGFTHAKFYEESAWSKVTYYKVKL